MADIDWTDPCAVAAALRPAYYQLISGAAAVRIRIENRDVEFAKTSVETLRVEISRLDAACAIKQGMPTTRYAIRAGSRRVVPDDDGFGEI